jgi:hypothetical protein
VARKRVTASANPDENDGDGEDKNLPPPERSTGPVEPLAPSTPASGTALPRARPEDGDGASTAPSE